MDYRDSPEEAAFRAELRAWLGDHVPEAWNEPANRARSDELYREWHQRLYAAGYMGMSWPPEYGGRGLSPVYDAILNEEVGRAGAPRLPIIGHIGRALYLYGTHEQRTRFLPPLLSGQQRWCQGFSEPDAGSDIASLRTRAERVDGTYVITGQKMWTSLAIYADWCIILVRTDPDAARHAGISCLLVDMGTPGISVEAIRMANGDSETCVTFWDGVVVPEENLLGQPGDGWRIASSTLSHERGPSNQGFIAMYTKDLQDAAALAAQRGLLEDPATRRELAMAYVRGEVLRLVAIEQLSASIDTGVFGPEGSIAKLLWTEAEQTMNHLLLDLAGPTAVTGQRPDVVDGYLYSRQASVYGGTSQIQKNIIAKAMLGMGRPG